jgi:hypothetical protein
MLNPLSSAHIATRAAAFSAHVVRVRVRVSACVCPGRGEAHRRRHLGQWMSINIREKGVY